MEGFVIFIRYFLVFFNIYFLFPVDKKLTDIVFTDKGPVRGEIVRTVQNSIEYSAFRGIPYAKPPIGKLRFKPPLEADPWNKVFDATNEPTLCPQLNNTDSTSFLGSEDCLYLNVFTPKTRFDNSKHNLKAVMIWIYGGGFYERDINSNRYGPDHLIEDDVIVVDMNYRPGALGFLSLDHSNATGNAGLKDQNLAMKWVQKNIRKFGGDPRRVTIFGQSAGAAAVTYHVLSEASKGLFNASIAMSGSALNSWAISSRDQAVSRAFELGRKLGIETTSKDVLLERLYKATAEEIVRAVSPTVGLDIFYKPTIEDPTIATEPFITECSVRKFKAGNFTHVPMILGFVRYEQLPVGSDLADSGVTLTQIFAGEEISKYINLAELGKETEHPQENKTFLFINTISDYVFVEGIDRTQRYLAESSKPIYYYRNSFDYDHPYHVIEGNFTKLNGTSHSDDIYHLFWLPNADQSLDPSSAISRQRKRMVRMWTNFAKYHNPTPNGTADPILNVTWVPSGKEGLNLEIGQTNLTMQARPIDRFTRELQRMIRPFEEKLNGCL